MLSCFRLLLSSVSSTLRSGDSSRKLEIQRNILDNIFSLVSWILGSFTLLVSICALWLTTLLLTNDEAKQKVQSVITSLLSLNLVKSNQPRNEKIEVTEELDLAIESFFKRIIRNFISSWYSNVTQDEMFVWNIKQELAEAIREIALRLRDVSVADHVIKVELWSFQVLLALLGRPRKTSKQ